MDAMSSDDSDLSFLQAAFLTMLDASDEGVIVLDGSGRCCMIGRRAAEMFGIDAGAYVGKPGAEVLEALANACDEPDTFWRAADAPLGAPTSAAEVDVRRPLARTVFCRAISVGARPLESFSPDLAPDGEPGEGASADRPQERSLGAGEAAQGPAGAAIANAFAAATGKRLRDLPLTPARVKAALEG